MAKKSVKKREKKKLVKRTLKSDVEIIRDEDKKTEDDKPGNSPEDELIADKIIFEDAGSAELTFPSSSSPVLERTGRVQQTPSFRLERWAEETPPATTEENDDPSKYSLPKIGVAYIEAQQDRIDPTRIDLMKIGKEERTFGQQASFIQSSEARINNSPVVERYETAERFDREKIGREEDAFGKKTRYDAKFSGR